MKSTSCERQEPQWRRIRKGPVHNREAGLGAVVDVPTGRVSAVEMDECRG